MIPVDRDGCSRWPNGGPGCLRQHDAGQYLFSLRHVEPAMPPTDSLGIGFVGTGFITETFHAETLRGIRHARATGIMNPTREKAERVAPWLRETGCGDPTVHDTVDAVVRDPDGDAVWVTSPNYVRVETVRRVVEGLTGGD